MQSEIEKRSYGNGMTAIVTHLGMKMEMLFDVWKVLQQTGGPGCGSKNGQMTVTEDFTNALHKGRTMTSPECKQNGSFKSKSCAQPFSSHPQSLLSLSSKKQGCIEKGWIG